MHLMIPVRNFLVLEAADVFSLLLWRYKTRHLLQRFSAVEMLYKHLMKGKDRISSYLRDEETEAQRKKMIHPRSPHRAGAKSGLPSPSSTSTQWVTLYQHPAGRFPEYQIPSNRNQIWHIKVCTAMGRVKKVFLPLHSCIFHWDGQSNFLRRQSMGRKEDLGLDQLIQCGMPCASTSSQVP